MKNEKWKNERKQNEKMKKSPRSKQRLQKYFKCCLRALIGWTGLFHGSLKVYGFC